ncbi:MAG: thiamine pyrophosphate-binding protein [Haloarculaceae archaeon]
MVESDKLVPLDTAGDAPPTGRRPYFHSMNAHQAIIDVLAAEGVDTLFTLMAEDTLHLLSDIDENHRDDLDIVQTRHEQGAMAMADGYARSTGDVGVCMVGRGPGIAQTGTALVTARKNGSNLLAIVPEAPTSKNYDIKEFKQEAYLESTVENVISARSAETLVPRLREGFRQVRTGDGPVVVQVAWDVLDGDADFDYALDGPSGLAAQRGTGAPDPDAVDEAVERYLDSDATKPPLILAGRGAVAADAKDALIDLGEQTGGVLATTLRTEGYFDDHPYSVGFVGTWGRNLANEHIVEADFVFAAGCSLNPKTTDGGRLIRDDAKVVHVDTDESAIERYTPVDVGIVSDAVATAEAFTAELAEMGISRADDLWTDRLRERIAAQPDLDEGEFPDVEGRVDPRALVQALDEYLPAERQVISDGGHFTRWVVDGVHTQHPDDFVWTLDFAAIGLGLGAGIGAAVASEKPSVLFCGDAGFQMMLQELNTAVRKQVPLVVVVMNDDMLGSEYHNLDKQTDYVEAPFIDSPDFAEVAASMGATGHTVRSVDDVDALGDVLGEAPTGPVVVDCKINHEVRHRSKL